MEIITICYPKQIECKKSQGEIMQDIEWFIKNCLSDQEVEELLKLLSEGKIKEYQDRLIEIMKEKGFKFNQ